MPSLSALDRAVLRTLAYADVFDYPLAAGEVHDYLICLPADAADTGASIERLAAGGRIEACGEWYCLPGRAALREARRSREATSARLWMHARAWSPRVAALPFARMVAVTGGLAMNNASAANDIDLLIVCAEGRVWLTRLMAVALVRMARAGGVGLCPNYVLSERALAQSQRDLYIAHEIAQMRPLAGAPLFDAFQRANAWWRTFLPNARTHAAPAEPPAGLLRAAGERVLGGRFGDRLESREHAQKHAKLVRQSPASPAARLDASAVKGHFNDHGARVLREYERRVALVMGAVERSAAAVPDLRPSP